MEYFVGRKHFRKCYSKIIKIVQVARSPSKMNEQLTKCYNDWECRYSMKYDQLNNFTNPTWSFTNMYDSVIYV